MQEFEMITCALYYKHYYDCKGMLQFEAYLYDHKSRL
jgi:hypothetical protein